METSKELEERIEAAVLRSWAVNNLDDPTESVPADPQRSIPYVKALISQAVQAERERLLELLEDEDTTAVKGKWGWQCKTCHQQESCVCATRNELRAELRQALTEESINNTKDE